MSMLLQVDCDPADGGFGALKDFVIGATGLSYFEHRDRELAERIGRRYLETGITDCQSYLRLLRSGSAGQEEVDRLIEALTNGETYFFRHAELFSGLEQTILPELIERNKQHRRLRIWSAGVSIGAEAYTVSILLRRQLAHLVQDWDLTIIGTDINRSFLARAARAEFEDWALRDVSKQVKQHCFTRRGDVWKLNPRFQQGVSFQYHNLVEHPYLSMPHNLFAFDLILCRNVMIYFNEPAIERTVESMRDCLVDDGWLVVGHAEHTLDRFRQFRQVNLSGAIAYQRVDSRHSSTAVSRRRSLPAGNTGQQLPRRQSESPPMPAPEESPPATHPDELATIRRLADQGQISAAAVRCEKLLRSRKLDPTCNLYYALILEQLGKHLESERALRRAIHLDGSFVLAHYYLGLALRRLGRNADAAQSLRHAHDLLQSMAAGAVIGEYDGLTVADLNELIRMQLDMLES